MKGILTATALAAVIVISTPSGQSNVVFSSGSASHVTSDYSAQIDGTFAGPGQHVVATPAGTVTAQGGGQTATVTVVGQ